MATVACVFVAVPASRRPHDVIHPPGGRSTTRAESRAEVVHRPPRPSSRAGCRGRLRPGRSPRPAPPVNLDGAGRRRPPPARLDPRGGRPPGRRDPRASRLRACQRGRVDGGAGLPQPATTEADAWVATQLTTILAGRAARAAKELTAPGRAGSAWTRAGGAWLRSAAAISPATSTGSATTPHAPKASRSPTGAVEGACRHLIGRSARHHRRPLGAHQRRDRPEAPKRTSRRRPPSAARTVPPGLLAQMLPRTSGPCAFFCDL